MLPQIKQSGIKTNSGIERLDAVNLAVERLGDVLCTTRSKILVCPKPQALLAHHDNNVGTCRSCSERYLDIT